MSPADSQPLAVGRGRGRGRGRRKRGMRSAEIAKFEPNKVRRKDRAKPPKFPPNFESIFDKSPSYPNFIYPAIISAMQGRGQVRGKVGVHRQIRGEFLAVIQRKLPRNMSMAHNVAV